MAAITPITIRPHHITNPDDYSNLAENKLIFSTTGAEDEKKVICPIYLNELEIGSTCYKVNCCNQVFSSDLKIWFAINSTCPLCRKELKITAVSEDDIIMGISHKKYDLKGIQFHPESYMTENGKMIIENWLKTGL